MLLEREHVLAELTAALGEAVRGSGRLVFLAGEAGIGKTSVVTALAADAPEGVAVRRGACDSIAASAALGPFLDAVPELAAVLEDPAEVDRLTLFRRLRAALGTSPTLLVLEDVHWADEATLEVLRFLGRRLAGLPLLVVATYRDDEVAATAPLTALLGDLATAPGVSRLALSALTVDAVRRLVEQSGAAVDAEELHGSTGGNPFFATEVLAAPGAGLPASVRDAVLARTSRLSPDARQVLAAAAVLGSPASLQQLVSVADVPAVALDECVASGVLVAGPGGWAFRHDLARRAVEDTLPPVTRATLHARALLALHATGERDAARLANHAAEAGDDPAVLLLAPEAAARSARLGAHLEAADLYRLALRAAENLGAERVALLEALAYECYLTGRLEEALRARRAAGELAAEDGDLAAVGRNQRWISRLSWFLGRNADSNLFAARAVATLEGVDDGHELGMAYSNLAQLRMLDGDTAATVAVGNRAIEFARRIGDREVEMHALNNVGTALASEDDAQEGWQLVQRSLAMALEDDAHEHAARAWTNLASMAVSNRRYADADRFLREGIGYSEERDLDSWALYLRSWLARSLADQGRLEAAATEADRVLERPHLSPLTWMTAAVVAGTVAARRGEPDRGLLTEALAVAASTGEEQRLAPVAAARAEVAWLAGRLDDVVAEVDRAWVPVVAHRNGWSLGELSWWLAVVGVRRPSPVPVAPPFALMLAGEWRAAATVWEGLGSPLWTALALGASPDLADGRRAVELADALGAPAVRAALLRDRHAHGIPVPRGPRGTAAGHPARLTARELEVLGLLAEGLSDAEVARRLYLSEKTVGHHVSAVLRKLDQPSRSRAVASALRRHIITPR